MINERQKWPTNKKAYDRNYLRIFGVKCPVCNGSGVECVEPNGDYSVNCVCRNCDGLGYIERKGDRE